MAKKWGTVEHDTICKRCGDEYQLDDGCDPTKYCHSCAQAMVPILEAEVKNSQTQEAIMQTEWCAARVEVERLRGRVRDLTSDIILVINGKFTKDSWDEKDLARLQDEFKAAQGEGE